MAEPANNSGEAGIVGGKRLKKELGLYAVFAISTGAMFSSGFFLLPGLAFAQAGPAVFLAYLLAGVLILPAMFSMAELSTALPRAGGSYYFLDRSLGPMAGTIGGLGTYLALTLKTAFALIGIGAYAAFFIDLPIKPIAVALTVVFMIINLLGAKETTALQGWLVAILIAIMALFMIGGLIYIGRSPSGETSSRFSPFFTAGTAGLFSTIGFVFVSYAGLTKVASVAEEIRNPERNIPLGMILSLIVVTIVYVLGVFLIVAIASPDDLKADLTPVATAADEMFTWLPAKLGLMLVVIAALAAFASTGNAGLLAASRYPLAMARDRLLPPIFATLGRFSTPTPAILATSGLMILFIVAFDAEKIAKLASAFQLFIFMLINFAVIVMRESRITSYDPGYRSPLYPWMQYFGILTSLALIAYMGWAAVLFTIGVIVICLMWYFLYARSRVERHGAIFHWFARLGTKQSEGLDREFRGIMKEKGLRDEDPFDQIVARSMVIDLKERKSFDDVLALASERFAERIPVLVEDITERFMEGTLSGHTPVTRGVALPHFRVSPLDQAEMVLIRSAYPIVFPGQDEDDESIKVNAIFCLISPEDDPAQHLRILAQIAGRVDESSFADAWASAEGEQELREILLRDERFAIIRIVPGSKAMAFKGKRIRDLDLPPGCLIAVVQRDEQTLIPSGNTILRTGDRLTLIGEAAGIETVREYYDPIGPPQAPTEEDADPDTDPDDESPAGPVRSAEAIAEIKRHLTVIAMRSVDREPARVQSALDAMKRLAAGTYGICTECGKQMSEEWIALRPDDPRCAECEERAHQ